MSVAYIQVHFRLDFFMEANNMNHDQAAPKGAVWSGSILFAIVATLEYKQMSEQMTNVMTGGLSVKYGMQLQIKPIYLFYFT